MTVGGKDTDLGGWKAGDPCYAVTKHSVILFSAVSWEAKHMPSPPFRKMIRKLERWCVRAATWHIGEVYYK